MEDNNYKVYIHTNKINNKKYIGITCQKPIQRWRNGNGYKECPKFWNAIQKYGWDNFDHEIVLCNLSKEQAEIFEIEMIKYYKSNNRNFGYNIENGGNIVGTHSEETKRKISKSNKGKKLSEETKKKMRLSHYGKQSGENNSMYGKHHSQETKELISKSKKGKKLSEESKNKMSLARKGKNHPMYGKKHSKETIDKIKSTLKGKMAGEKHPLYGKHHTEETKKKLSIICKKNSVNRREIICLNTLKIYNSAKEASEELNLDRSCIAKVCKGKRLQTKGYKFMYLEDYNNLNMNINNN